MEAEDLLVTEFLSAHPEDAARLLEELPATEATKILEDTPAKAAAEVVRAMSAYDAVACLKLMKTELASATVAALPVEIALALLRRMEQASHDEILASLPAPVQKRLQLLLRYPEGTAGSMMDPLIQVVPGDITVEEALRRVRAVPERLYYYLYVVDRSHALTGVVDLRGLMLAPSDALVSSVMTEDVVKLDAQSNLRSVSAHPAWRDVHALPVVDEKGIFVGAIRQTLLRRAEEESTSARDRQRGLDTLVALGELYWVGMCELFGGLSAASSAPQGRSGLVKRAQHRS